MIDGLAQLRDHPIVQRVQLVGTIDRDGRDAVAHLERDRFVGHGRESKGTRHVWLASVACPPFIGLPSCPIPASMTAWICRRGSKKAGFRYVDANGRAIRDARTL